MGSPPWNSGWNRRGLPLLGAGGGASGTISTNVLFGQMGKLKPPGEKQGLPRQVQGIALPTVDQLSSCPRLQSFLSAQGENNGLERKQLVREPVVELTPC